MADIENHDDDKLSINDEDESTVTHNNDGSSGLENSQQENVCIVSSSNPNQNEILLYVGEGNPQVQDLLRVTLNQSSSTLVGTSASLDGKVGEIQSIGTDGGHTLISVPVSSISESNSSSQVAPGQVVQLHIQGESSSNSMDSKEQHVNNLFHLADLSNSLNTDDQETENHVDIDTSHVLKSETETLMGEFIIENVDTTETERIPGTYTHALTKFNYNARSFF